MAIGKRSGRKSQGSNDFLMPKTPTIGTATNVGTSRAYNNGSATVTFTADPTYAADSFTVTSTPGSFTATAASSPITVTGLQSDTAYTFKVTATNTYGTSGESAASNSITATTVPATPAAPTAASPNADEDQVSWSAPANGGSVITNYHWQSNEDPVKEGDTATTASVTLVQEAGTLQRYKVYATNANGNSEYSALSNEITTTFSFVPFSVFGFSPFQVFGFSPFAVFGFSPFSVFGFSPFRVFGFSPFRVFGFSPICFDEHSLILTDAGYKKAKDITDEDTLVLSVFDEMPLANIDTIGLWKSKSLTNIKNINSKVTYTKMHEVENTTIFNEDIHNRVSNTEEVLILRDAEYLMMKTDSVALGDKLVKFVDNQEVHEVVNKVDSVKEKRNVYEFGREVFGLINASGVLVYHLYPID
jgi:hypothetical protein